MARRAKRGPVAFGLAALLLIALVAAGCGSSGSEASSSGSDGVKIAILLPEHGAPVYSGDHRPEFGWAVEQVCGDCEVLENFPASGVREQQKQAEAALSQGADVLVVDPDVSKSAAAVAAKAKAQGVPVVSYDGLIENSEVDAYVFYDDEEIGELQANTLASKLKEDGKASGPIVMINGAPKDPSAAAVKKGAQKGFAAAGVDVVKEYDTPGGYAEDAQIETKEALAALGKDGFAAVYAADDELGGGAIQALDEADIDLEDKPVTGEDASMAALRRILAGQQYMTVYKRISPEAKASAEVAIALAEGKGVPGDKVTEEIDNGAGKVPAVRLTPIAVDKGNLRSTVIADEYVLPVNFCLGPYVAACKEAKFGGY